MKFQDFEYKRPNIDTFIPTFKNTLQTFKDADSVAIQSDALAAIQSMIREFDSMQNICHVRHTIDTTDKQYEEENNYFDQNMPKFSDLVNDFYKALLSSKFRTELEEKWGGQLFVIADLNTKTIRPDILDDLTKENVKSSEYVKVRAKAKINFEDKEYTLSTILPLEIGEDRATRKAAAEAKWDFYTQNSSTIEGIYDELVGIRTGIAKKLGYENFVELGYARMLRSDYNAEMVANFREQIRKHVVPLCQKLIKRQAKRLGLDNLKYYDEGFKFKSGNPAPKGKPEWIVEQATTMYKELSNETDEFFNFMRDNNLMDLVNKKGKAMGGYCTFISKYKAPYIFSNFNGTSGDIDVLTHEAGHAFQIYSSKDIPLYEYNWPTYEACEIHSMSMEFFTWPWMELFFKEDTNKYKFMHMAGSLMFLPYGVSIDEFQHFVYENPNATPAERNATWRNIERKYLPHKDYDGNEFLENGGLWQKQAHVFGMPFYYIDYTLAQICAFQFWIKDQKDHTSAWKDYVDLCKKGGSQSFLGLVESANLKSPFEDGVVEEICNEISTWLDSVDDSNF